jgi:hypothetical protein
VIGSHHLAEIPDHIVAVHRPREKASIPDDCGVLWVRILLKDPAGGFDLVFLTTLGLVTPTRVEGPLGRRRFSRRLLINRGLRAGETVRLFVGDDWAEHIMTWS